MRKIVSRDDLREQADQEDTLSGRLAELYFLSSEPRLIDLMWKIAGMSDRARGALQNYFARIDDPALVTVVKRDGDQIVLHANQAKMLGSKDA